MKSSMDQALGRSGWCIGPRSGVVVGVGRQTDGWMDGWITNANFHAIPMPLPGPCSCSCSCSCRRCCCCSFPMPQCQITEGKGGQQPVCGRAFSNVPSTMDTGSCHADVVSGPGKAQAMQNAGRIAMGKGKEGKGCTHAASYLTAGGNLLNGRILPLSAGSLTAGSLTAGTHSTPPLFV